MAHYHSKISPFVMALSALGWIPKALKMSVTLYSLIESSDFVVHLLLHPRSFLRPLSTFELARKMLYRLCLD